MNYYRLKENAKSLDKFYDKVMDDNYKNNKSKEPVKEFLKANGIDIGDCFTYFGELYAKTNSKLNNDDFISISEIAYKNNLEQYNEFNGFNS